MYYHVKFANILLNNIIYKPRILEKDQNLEQIRRSVINQETKQITNLTPFMKKDNENTKNNKVYKLNVNDQNFDIKNKGKNENNKNLKKKPEPPTKNISHVNKITPKNQPLSSQNNLHNNNSTIHNISHNISSEQNNNIPKPTPNVINQIKQIGQSNNYHQINKPNNKQFNNIRARSILNNHQNTSENINNIQKIQRPQLPKQNTYIPPSRKPMVKELVLTRKCKKCHQ